MERLEELELIVDMYVQILDDEALPDVVRAHFDAGRAQALVDLKGERGARGLNPDTGEKE